MAMYVHLSSHKFIPYINIFNINILTSLGGEDPLEKEMAIHSSTLAWKIPWMEEPDRLQSMGSQSRTRLSDFTFTSLINIFVKILLYLLILKTLKVVCQQFEAIFAKPNSWQDSTDDSGSLTSIQWGLFCYIISKNNLKYALSQNIKQKIETKSKTKTNPFFLHISNFFTTPSPCKSERKAKSTLT